MNMNYVGYVPTLCLLVGSSRRPITPLRVPEVVPQPTHPLTSGCYVNERFLILLNTSYHARVRLST